MGSDANQVKDRFTPNSRTSMVYELQLEGPCQLLLCILYREETHHCCLKKRVSLQAAKSDLATLQARSYHHEIGLGLCNAALSTKVQDWIQVENDAELKCK